MTGRNADGHGSTDSAGLPWAGRTLTAQQFADDRGAVDPGLDAALIAWSATPEDVMAEATVVNALLGTRVLVPVVAQVGAGHPVDHVRGDANAELALALLTRADGSRALPAFSGVAALAQWDPAARPIPVPAERAAHAALAEGLAELILDPAGPVPFPVCRSALQALAQSAAWVPAGLDPAVCEVVEAASLTVRGVLASRARPAPLGVIVAELKLVAGLDAAGVQRLCADVGEGLARHDLIVTSGAAVRLVLR